MRGLLERNEKYPTRITSQAETMRSRVAVEI